MDIKGKNFLLIGGAGLIGSHTLDQLLKEDVAKVTIFDNFTRGSFKNIEEAMKDSELKYLNMVEISIKLTFLKNLCKT